MGLFVPRCAQNHGKLNFLDNSNEDKFSCILKGQLQRKIHPTFLLHKKL